MYIFLLILDVFNSFSLSLIIVLFYINKILLRLALNYDFELWFRFSWMIEQPFGKGSI